MNGILSGGWGFVYAAYGITGTILILYVIQTLREFLISRDRRDELMNERQGRAS